MSDDQAESLRRQAEHCLPAWPRAGVQHCRVLAVTGGKGGVGKTNVAVNLSLALCEAGARVLLLDADLGLANADVLLGLSPRYTLHHVFFREVGLAQVVMDGPLGLKVLPGGTGLPDLTNLSTLELVRLLGELRTLEREQDLLVIDTAAGISNLVLRFALAADEIIIVSAPEPAAMLDAYGVMKALRNNRVQGQFHLLMNMARWPGEALEAYHSMAFVARRYLELELGYLGSLPQDEAIVQCIKQQRPFFLKHPQAPAAQQLRQVARRFLAGLAIASPARGDSFFARLLGGMR